MGDLVKEAFVSDDLSYAVIETQPEQISPDGSEASAVT
jgi:hypothetical protein